MIFETFIYLSLKKKVRYRMVKFSVSQDEIRKVDNFLRGYQLNQKLLKLDRYERNFLGYRDSEESFSGDIPMAKAKMFEIRHFITDLENGDEKLLLYYHYVRGETVEKCAELLGISRSSGFRLKKRALCMAATEYGKVKSVKNMI